MSAASSSTGVVDIAANTPQRADQIREQQKLEYLQTHNVYGLVDGALSDLLETLPDDPYLALAAYFRRHSRSPSEPAEPKPFGSPRQ